MPEWDVLHMILGKSKVLFFDVNCIRCFQNKNYLYAALPFEARLDCDANKLAERQHSRPRPTHITRIPKVDFVPSQIFLDKQK